MQVIPKQNTQTIIDVVKKHLDPSSVEQPLTIPPPFISLENMYRKQQTEIPDKKNVEKILP